jgi:hypothetical protein
MASVIVNLGSPDTEELVAFGSWKEALSTATHDPSCTDLGVGGGKALAEEGLKGNSVITDLNIADNKLANYGHSNYRSCWCHSRYGVTKLDINSNGVPSEQRGGH